MQTTSSNRQRAIAEGLSRYFTGVACRSGHIAERSVANNTCVECLKKATRKYQKANPEKVSVWMVKARTKYAENNADKVVASKRRYREANVDALRAKGRDYVARNIDAVKARNRRQRKERPWVHAENQRRRQLMSRKAMPTWADRDAIRSIYEKAAVMRKESGIAYTVDHIFPLRGKDVCGLHVENNLQILTLKENCSKGAKSASATN